MSPISFVGHVLFAPLRIHGVEFFVDFYSVRIFKTVRKTYLVGGVDVAARAVSHAKPIVLRAPEHRNFVAFFYGQRAVVFEQNYAFGSHLSCAIAHILARHAHFVFRSARLLRRGRKQVCNFGKSDSYYIPFNPLAPYARAVVKIVL